MSNFLVGLGRRGGLVWDPGERYAVFSFAEGKKSLIFGTVQFKENPSVKEKFDMSNFSEGRSSVVETCVPFTLPWLIVVLNFLVLLKSSACRTFWRIHE